MENNLKGPAGSSENVAILLCTLNGARFLPEQLSSFTQQDHANWSLTVSDDGSTDSTLSMLDAFSTRHGGRVTVRSGPQQGHAQNFLSLATDPGVDADYFAYSDQDDIWLPDHLSKAIAILNTISRSQPALYCGRTRLIAEDGAFLGYSPLFRRPPSFRNAVMQSIAGGNTMVMNRAAQQLLFKARQARPVAHDWWTYQLVSAAGGFVHYDPAPTVLYRQHSTNQVGSNLGFHARWQRTKMLLSGRFANWTHQNLTALESVEELFTSENRDILRHMAAMRNGSLRLRVASFFQSGIYRQTALGSLGLGLAVALNRV